jgi:PleD family two-component response regulator
MSRFGRSTDLVISDALPDVIRVLLVAATGVLRGELRAAFDDDFDVAAAADARAAAEAARAGAHALVVVADDLYNCTTEEVIQRVRVAAPEDYRVAVLVLTAHGDLPDLSGPFHWGADDVARWPLEGDMFRARVRSLVRVAMLESAMGRAAERGRPSADELREALASSIHLVNNAVAGISGRAQLATLTGADDEGGLVPVCLSEARKMSLILGALHRLAETLETDQPDGEPALTLAGAPQRG